LTRSVRQWFRALFLNCWQQEQRYRGPQSGLLSTVRYISRLEAWGRISLLDEWAGLHTSGPGPAPDSGIEAYWRLSFPAHLPRGFSAC
jgi:hypothetical protein